MNRALSSRSSVSVASSYVDGGSALVTFILKEQDEALEFGLKVNLPAARGVPDPRKINSWLPVDVKSPDPEKLMPFVVAVFIE